MKSMSQKLALCLTMFALFLIGSSFISMPPTPSSIVIDDISGMEPTKTGPRKLPNVNIVKGAIVTFKGANCPESRTATVVIKNAGGTIVDTTQSIPFNASRGDYTFDVNVAALTLNAVYTIEVKFTQVFGPQPVQSGTIKRIAGLSPANQDRNRN